jgi:hypothetical protein
MCSGQRACVFARGHIHDKSYEGKLRNHLRRVATQVAMGHDRDNEVSVPGSLLGQATLRPQYYGRAASGHGSTHVGTAIVVVPHQVRTPVSLVMIYIQEMEAGKMIARYSERVSHDSSKFIQHPWNLPIAFQYDTLSVGAAADVVF